MQWDCESEADSKLGATVTDIDIFGIGKLAEPAKLLIEKVSIVFEGVFRPFQIVRVAKAEAKAKVISTRSRIKEKSLERRAEQRWRAEQCLHQQNMESITKQAIPLLDKKANPKQIENDWISNFFDKCRIISNSDMQQLWARILASEANRAGSFSRKTINMLADIEKSDAEAFNSLCRFTCTIQGQLWVFVHDLRHEIYEKNGVNLQTLSHLDYLGFLNLDLKGVLIKNLPKQISVAYRNKPVTYRFKKSLHNDDYWISVGFVTLTKAGSQLAPICQTTPVMGFPEYVNDHLVSGGLTPIDENMK